MCNLLILSAGRRVELIQCFKRAAERLNIQSKIVAGDCQESAPALYFADERTLLPRISDPNYVSSIIDACNQHNIALVIPTIDTDLLLLSREKERIEESTGARVLVSSPEVIRICRDKTSTNHFLRENGFLVPHTYSLYDIDPEELVFPLFIKPRDGSSSINAFKVDCWGTLKHYLELVPNPILQTFIDGEEYTVDTFLDFGGNVITIVPRLRVATRSGEISKGRIVRDREIIEDVKRLLEVLKPVGHITVQCIKSSRGIEYIEINPRFGGGAPMSIMSGADSCEALYRILGGERLVYNENYQDGLLLLRFDNSICLNENMEIVGLAGDNSD